MVFSNLLFVFLFLPLNLLFYYIPKKIETKNWVMLIFSLIFYAWGEPVYILLMLLMTFVDWFLMLILQMNEGIFKRRRLVLIIAIAFNLSLLGIFKYGSFFIENFYLLFGISKEPPAISLPIGISFYTFQLISYCVDVYKRRVPAQKSFKTLLLYVSLFHQCIAGPIIRYKDVCDQLEHRIITKSEVHSGIERFTIGLFKKAVLANSCAEIVTTLIPLGNIKDIPILSLWVGMIAFSLQIYLDFSAYSDMAIGMGKMIGIHYTENFRFPYLSRSISEFWRRWHITLGTFFRDYVYFPLGGSRGKLPRTILNLLIVWILTGFWHGANWNFILWGLYFFIFIALEKLFLGKLLSKAKIFSHTYLIFLIIIGWVFFKFENLSDIILVLKGMFGLNSNSLINFENWIIILNFIPAIIFSIICSTPLFSNIYKKLAERSLLSNFGFITYSAVNIALPILLLALSVAALIGNTYNPFLYFRF